MWAKIALWHVFCERNFLSHSRLLSSYFGPIAFRFAIMYNQDECLSITFFIFWNWTSLIMMKDNSMIWYAWAISFNKIYLFAKVVPPSYQNSEVIQNWDSNNTQTVKMLS